VVGGRRRNRLPRRLAGSVARSFDLNSHRDVSSVRRGEVAGVAAQSPGSKEWSGKAGAARGDAPTDNRADLNVSTETGSPLHALMTRRLRGEFGAAPTSAGIGGQKRKPGPTSGHWMGCNRAQP
jgi:hypothetical protein